MKNKIFSLLAGFALALLSSYHANAQFTVDGDFRTRWYSDSFDGARDNRGTENYMRYLGRIRGKAKVGRSTSFFTEVITLIDNPGAPVRNIAGTGSMRWGVSQVYAEMTEPNFLVFDLVRLRLGRQQFPLGEGLTLGESYYFIDKFDGCRIDLAYHPFTLSLFGAITGQNLSASGLYPDPGSDQLYVARLGASLGKQNVMTYCVLQRLRGLYNDNETFGAGASGELLVRDLVYSAEAAYQNFATVSGLPKKAGIGYLGGISYRFGLGPFRSIKVETRYAAYEGDDAKTIGTVEQFSPPYPSFFWGSRAGYVNGDIGGDFPRNGQNLEGSRIWYTRCYVIPSVLPKLRIQVQYIKVKEYIDNDGYNWMDDEFSARLYYTLSSQSQLQLRYTKVIPNGDDKDVDGNGNISYYEDRLYVRGLMLEWQIQF